jgi:hypothetical protein
VVSSSFSPKKHIKYPKHEKKKKNDRQQDKNHRNAPIVSFKIAVSYSIITMEIFRIIIALFSINIGTIFEETQETLEAETFS